MKLSIITVTYNSDLTLSNTIQSVLQQSYNNIEYIIVDGLSRDRTIEIIKEYEPIFHGRLKWISEKDNGLYDAMNKGIKMATGDIIGILNSDDIYIDKYVIEDVVVSILQKKVDAIYGNLYYVKKKDLSSIIRVWKGYPYPKCGFGRGWHPAHPTFFVKRVIYENFGYFDTSFKISADFELMLRFLEKYHINAVYIDRFMVKMRIGGESSASLIKILEGNINVMRAFEKNDISVSIFYPLLRLFPKIFDVLKSKFKWI
ncbi:putative glycosyltransferase [termite gut metagenome]|uniref:Putative glycosyltransferase n=1 Tax=termite gut metagenome TaxID=433724 RepID=A0A5J4T3S6_9ZZZZ